MCASLRLFFQLFKTKFQCLRKEFLFILMQTQGIFILPSREIALNAGVHGETEDAYYNLTVGLRIKWPLASSISPEFYSWTGRGAFQLGTRAEVLSSILLGHAFPLRHRGSDSLSRYSIFS
jgi:hypothetical protein